MTAARALNALLSSVRSAPSLRPQDGTVSVIVLFTIVSSCVTDCNFNTVRCPCNDLFAKCHLELHIDITLHHITNPVTLNPIPNQEADVLGGEGINVTASSRYVKKSPYAGWTVLAIDPHIAAARGIQQRPSTLVYTAPFTASRRFGPSAVCAGRIKRRRITTPFVSVLSLPIRAPPAARGQPLPFREPHA